MYKACGFTDFLLIGSNWMSHDSWDSKCREVTEFNGRVE